MLTVLPVVLVPLPPVVKVDWLVVVTVLLPLPPVVPIFPDPPVELDEPVPAAVVSIEVLPPVSSPVASVVVLELQAIVITAKRTGEMKYRVI